LREGRPASAPITAASWPTLFLAPGSQLWLFLAAEASLACDIAEYHLWASRVSVGDMSLPITGKMNALAALDRQNGYAALRSSERYGRRMTARCASELKC
jgi:hypothetical protein